MFFPRFNAPRSRAFLPIPFTLFFFLQIADLLREKQLSLSSASGMPLAARTQIASLQRDLDLEKAKVRWQSCSS